MKIRLLGVTWTWPKHVLQTLTVRSVLVVLTSVITDCDLYMPLRRAQWGVPVLEVTYSIPESGIHL